MKFLPFFVLLTILGCVQPEPTPVPEPDKPAAGEVKFVAELIDAHNKIRESKGLKPLAMNPMLQKACERHAKDMAAKKFMSHFGSDWSSPFKRMSEAGYQYNNAGENVAWNQETVDGVMKAWMWSPGHRLNILGSYTEIGAACVYSTSDQPYWCVDFGTPAAGTSMRAESFTEPETDDTTSSIRTK